MCGRGRPGVRAGVRQPRPLLSDKLVGQESSRKDLRHVTGASVLLLTQKSVWKTVGITEKSWN